MYMKKLESTVLIVVLLVGIFGSIILVSDIYSFKKVNNLSSSWQTIASSKVGFNCNVTLRCLVTGTEGSDAVKPDIRMLDENGNVVWSENKSCPGHSMRVYNCGADVHTIQIKVSNGGGTARAY